MSKRVRFLGAYPHEGQSGPFFSNAFALETGEMFSLASNSNKLAGVDAGAVFEVSGLTFSPAVDEAGKALTTKGGDAVLNAKRDGDAEIELKFVRNGGFKVSGLPARA
jgi:hypothetical protein